MSIKITKFTRVAHRRKHLFKHDDDDAAAQQSQAVGSRKAHSTILPLSLGVWPTNWNNLKQQTVKVSCLLSVHLFASNWAHSSSIWFRKVFMIHPLTLEIPGSCGTAKICQWQSVASTKMNARHTPRTLPIIQEVAHIIVLLWQGQEQQSECLHCWPCQELRSNQDLELNLFELTMSNFPLTLTDTLANKWPAQVQVVNDLPPSIIQDPPC